MRFINEGVINQNWTSYVSFADDQNTVESTPEFGTGLVGDNRKINDEIVPNFDTYTSDPIRISSNEPDLASRNGNTTPIEQILSNFNENYESEYIDRYAYNYIGLNTKPDGIEHKKFFICLLYTSDAADE